MRKNEDLPGIKISGQQLNNQKHADDTAVVAASEADL